MGINEMHVMNTSGHTKVTWNPDVPVEVEVARKAFEEMQKAGYHAFSVERRAGEERKGTRIDSFDPHAKEMLLIPQLRGG